jgi:hypothetical protein
VKKTPKLPPPIPQDAVYISFNQLRSRWGNPSHMFIERKIDADPKFPKPHYFGRLRFFKVSDVEEYERGCVTHRVA